MTLTMSKIRLTGKFSRSFPFRIRPVVTGGLALAVLLGGPVRAQDQSTDETDGNAPAAAASRAESESAGAEQEPAVEGAAAERVSDSEAVQPHYPISVALDGATAYVVDLDLPGVWRVSGETRELFFRGTERLRQPMNRPRCIAIHPDGGILVGDSATREIYRITGPEADPVPLTEGQIGIPMAIVVSPEGESLYAGDAEKRALVRIPLGGGKPEVVTRTNARGLAFDSEGNLWAVTPDAAAVHRIDVEEGSAEAVVTGRPYAYPNGLAWHDDTGYVTDIYGRCIWSFTPDGETERWHEGEPLAGPVGITADEHKLFVADPKSRQLFEFDLESNSVTPLL